jgi:hypothetical protein
MERHFAKNPAQLRKLSATGVVLSENSVILSEAKACP